MTIATSHAPISAARSKAAWAVLLISLFATLGVDLLSKELAFRYVAGRPVVVERANVERVNREIDPRAITHEIVPEHRPMVVVPELLHFTLVLNPGAVFGIGPGKRFFFVGFTLIALAFGMFMFTQWTRGSRRDWWAHAAIGMLLGGGLGNLYDRLNYACVRDFIHPLPGWKKPFGWTFGGGSELWPYVSNLADLFLLIGIGMLLVYLWRRDRGAVG